MLDRADELDMLVLKRVEGVFIATVVVLLLLLLVAMVELEAVDGTVGLAFNVIFELEGLVEKIESNELFCVEFCVL